jgi:ABC-type multidrug transport system permease subunit
MVSTMLHDRPVVCSSTEVSVFDPPSGQTCGAYLANYIATAGGTIQTHQRRPVPLGLVNLLLPAMA